jgi:MarR family transcriptional regulator for hemolysin
LTGVSAAKSASPRAIEGHAPRDRKLEPGRRVLAADTGKRRISLKMSIIARQLRNLFDQAVERDGLTRGKWSVIVAAARDPGATQRCIAAMLEITEVTAGQLIDRLCADGYLERREHPKDRRAYCVHLTEAAEPLLARLEEVAQLIEERVFAGIEERDLQQLDALLDVIARNLAASRERGEEKKSARAPLAAD